MPQATSYRPVPLALALALASTAALAAAPASPPAAQPAKAGSAKAAAAPVTITPAQKQQAVLQYAEMREMEAVGTRCHWLDPITQEAVADSYRERMAWLLWQHVDAKQADAKAAELVKQSQATHCDDAVQHQAVSFGGWQMRSSWAMRGHSMLSGGDHPAWYLGKSTVDKHRAALDLAISGLMAFNPKSVADSLTRFEKDTPALLAVRCTASDKGCPAPPAIPGYRTYAEQVLKSAESYAAALEHAKDKSGVQTFKATDKAATQAADRKHAGK